MSPGYRWVRHLGSEKPLFWLKRYWPVLVGLLYLASPIDLLPDSLLGLGWSDDLILLLLAYWLYRRGSAARHRMAGNTGSGGPGASSAHGYKGEQNYASDPWAVLGIPHGSSAEQIRSAYRKQAQRYHPDRVSHLGEEFQELANKRFQEIQKAYEVLTRGAR